MNKINLEALEKWASRATEDQLLIAHARAMGKISVFEYIAHKIIQPRLDYLESITPDNCTKRANSCIEDAEASD